MLNEFEQAKKRLEEALTIERIVHAEKHSELAPTLYFLGISYFMLNEFEQANKRLEEALTIERSMGIGAYTLFPWNQLL
jgi:tetratricopeptide (TPR) repeat protein